MCLSRSDQRRGSAGRTAPRQRRRATTENEAEVSSLLQDEKSPLDLKLRPNGRHGHPLDTAFGCPRNFLSSNRCVYTVVSPRAVGLSVGVNMNPDAHCNFDCLYCEVVRQPNGPRQPLAVEAMAVELQRTLAEVHSGRIRERGPYQHLPPELLKLRHVALSGDGEPTLCPNFVQAVQAVAHIRALGQFPFFKLVLITNSTGLDLPGVQQGLKSFTKEDEIWAKLDVGTQAYLNRVNRTKVSLERILANILLVARVRPVVIQSLFPLINDEEPTPVEIEQFALRLKELAAQGAQISLVQIHSGSRPPAHRECGHLPLKTLSHIALVVRKTTGLNVEVF